MTKFELPLSVNYVPSWGIVEAFRELFQNALDNQIENPNNEMGFVYNEETQTLSITNKSSSLEADSLLLGSTAKAGNNKTIGTHGEGYKLAFMVLLRNGKTVTVHNYGKRELWNVRFVNSKKYNNQPIPTVFVDKKYMWQKTPDNDLTIIVSEVTKEEYEQVVEKNLHLRADSINFIECKNGRILTDSSEKGNIYVKGLFVYNNEKFTYGYDFEPRVISLDRDRRLADSIRVSFETSGLWAEASDKSNDYRETMVKMFYEKTYDVEYITESFINGSSKVQNVIAEKFIEEHGVDAIPVSSDMEYNEVKDSGKKPVIVDEKIAQAIMKSDYAETVVVEKKKTLQELFRDFMDEIEDRLTDKQLEYMSELIDKIRN